MCKKIELIITFVLLIFFNIEHCKSAMLKTLQNFNSKRMTNSAFTKPMQKTCLTVDCTDAASSILRNIDEKVDPCDDFYKFSCGKFLKETMIPVDMTMIDTLSIINDELLLKLQSSIEETNKPDDSRIFGLLKTFYNSCMDETTIEQQKLEPMRRVLKDLGDWPVLAKNYWNERNFNWKESTYKFRKMGLPTHQLIDLSIDVDLKNNKNHMIYLDQPIFGLPMEYLTKGLDDKITRAYYDYMVNIAEIFGADRGSALSQMDDSLTFEMKLANISLSGEERHNYTQLYNPMTIEELSKNFPSIPWLEYVNAFMSPNTKVTKNEVVVMIAPSYFTKLENLLKKTSKRVLANYLMWRVVASCVDYLNMEIKNRRLKFLTVLNGVAKHQPRWKECVNVVSNVFPVAIGAIYVRTHFNGNAKKNIMELATNVISEFVKILKKLDWMDEKTKQAALSKAKTIKPHIAYPDELLDDIKLNKLFENLKFSPGGDYLKLHLETAQFNTEYQFEKLRKPVEKDNWINLGHSAIVNAFYSLLENNIQFPAGILQGDFFHKNRPQYMNYGAIGFVIGHEVTHGFDNHGQQFDKDGNLVNWWETSTIEKFSEKAECMIQQYNNYSVSDVKLNLNGFNTLGENIADNGGIKLAYLAYDEWVKKNEPEAALPNLKYTPRQLFWISSASSMCSQYRLETLRETIVSDIHSPAKFRVIGSMSNMREFSLDFKCPSGSRMNPEIKCSVW